MTVTINAQRDGNYVPTLLGISNADNKTPIPVLVDSVTNGLLISGTITATNPSVGTTAAAVPASATYIGANKSGNLVGLTLDTNGNLNVSTTASDTTSTGSITSTQSVAITTNGQSSVGVQIAGSFTGTLVFEASNDGGTTWVPTTVVQISNGTISSSQTGPYNGQANVGGLSNFRVRGNSIASGTANITLRASTGVATVMLDNPLPTGSNTIGAITQASGPWTVNATQINGSAIATAATGIMKVGVTDGTGTAITSTGAALDVNLKTSSITLNVSAAQSGNWTTRIVGNAGALIDAATGATVPANAVYVGRLAKTALPTAVSDGQLVGPMADKFGRTVVLPFGLRDNQSVSNITISNSTAETLLMGSVASVFSDITSLIIANTATTSGSVTRVDIKDGWGGIVRATFEVPNNDTRGIVYTFPLVQAAVNTAWTATCATAITDIRITVQTIQNK